MHFLWNASTNLGRRKMSRFFVNMTWLLSTSFMSVFIKALIEYRLGYVIVGFVMKMP